MALTILQAPQTWTSAYNDQWVLAESTEIAQPGFKYKAEVAITYDLNGTPDTKTFTDYYLPRPDGYCVFNTQAKVKNYIKHFIKPNEFNIVECVNSKVDVLVTVTETWTGEVAPDSDTASFFAWNASFKERVMYIDDYDWRDHISYDAAPWVKIHAINNDLNRPEPKVTMLTDVFVQFVKMSEIDSIVYYVIDTNGVDITDSVTLTGSMTDNKIYQINISPQLAVDQAFAIDVDYYVKVSFLKADLSVISSYQYRITELCTKHEINRLYYLNRNGGISFMQMEMLSSESIDSQTNTVKLSRNKIIEVASLGTWSYLPYQHEQNTVSTKETFSKKLQTNWITKQQSDDLEELFSSPLKWIVSEEDAYDDPFKFKPVTSIEKRYDFKKHENEKLFNYFITVEYSTEETRQRAI